MAIMKGHILKIRAKGKDRDAYVFEYSLKKSDLKESILSHRRLMRELHNKIKFEYLIEEANLKKCSNSWCKNLVENEMYCLACEKLLTDAQDEMTSEREELGIW